MFLNGSFMPHTIEIYGRDGCSWCKRAVALCLQQGLPYEYLDMSERPYLIEDFNRRSGGARTVPQIFVGQIHIGGHDDFRAKVLSGEIQQIIGGE